MLLRQWYESTVVESRPNQLRERRELSGALYHGAQANLIYTIWIASFFKRLLNLMTNCSYMHGDFNWLHTRCLYIANMHRPI